MAAMSSCEHAARGKLTIYQEIGAVHEGGELGVLFRVTLQWTGDDVSVCWDSRQPMGFYTPSLVIRDVRDRGVEVRAIDVTKSRWDCTLEVDAPAQAPELRLGLRLVKGLTEASVLKLLQAREPKCLLRRATYALMRVVAPARIR